MQRSDLDVDDLIGTMPQDSKGNVGMQEFQTMLHNLHVSNNFQREVPSLLRLLIVKGNHNQRTIKKISVQQLRAVLEVELTLLYLL